MEKRLFEIKKRKEELRSLVSTLSGTELDAAIKELDDMTGEEKSLVQDHEKRSKAMKALSGGKSVDSIVIEKPVDEPENRSFGVDSAEYRSAYLKRLQGNDLSDTEKRALTSVTGSVGSVIPTQTLNMIVEKLENAGIILPLVTRLNIPSNVEIPIESTTADLAWKAEADSATDSADVVSMVELGAYKLIKTISITAKVEAMSIDAFEGFLTSTLVRKVKVALDNAIINGTGSSQATGVLKALTATKTATADVLTYDDIMDNLLAVVKSAYKQGSVFCLSTTTLYKRVAKIKDDNKLPIFKLEADERFEGRLCGYPVVVCDYVPDDTIIFGNFEHYYMNISKDFSVEKDNSIGFRSGDVCYRTLGLVDGKVANTDGFAVLEVKPVASGS